MPDVADCAFLYVETALHAGAATPNCFADLPIERDEAGLPVVPGSTLRGGLLAAAGKLGAPDEITWAFGSPPADGKPQEGALQFNRCHLLLFPVRTYRGVFAWATCPQLLSAWQSAADGAGLHSSLPAVPSPGAYEAFVAPAAPLLATADSLIIEDFSFPARESGEVAVLGEWLARHALADDPGYAFFRERLARAIVLLPDDVCHFLVQHRVPLVRRVAIDPETGTAREGALFSEEYLPSETLLYAFLGTRPVEGVPPTPLNAVSWLKSIGLTRLQVGGRRTLGSGLVRWNWLNGG